MPNYTIKQVLDIPEYSITFTRIKDQKIHIGLVPYKRSKAACSHCGKVHAGKPHSRDTVEVKDLDISGKKVVIHLTKRNYHCPDDGRIHVESISWLKPHARVTNRYAEHISRLTAITTNTEAGWFVGLDDEVVYRIDKAHLEEQAATKLTPIPNGFHLSVDEVSYKKYHNYLTNVIDTERKVVIWNQKGRKAEILDQYYQGIGQDNCELIKSVAMDGARTYISSTKKYAVNALIVYDKFHLVQKLNHTVDEVRKQELRKARGIKDQALIDLMNCKKRFLLLKNKTKLTPSQSSYLDQLCQLNAPIYKAMLLKDSFLQIYSLGSEDEAIVTKHLVDWLAEATNSGVQAFIELADKLSNKMDYILNWFKQKVSSAISEGFNNKIKRLKRMAYGYRDVEYFRLKIHQHCGLLNPRLST